jgi:hypothetical protein
MAIREIINAELWRTTKRGTFKWLNLFAGIRQVEPF